jgi:hydroxymethylbilane synthase
VNHPSPDRAPDASSDAAPGLDRALDATLPPLRLGTRGSRLALTQSRWVADRIEAATGRAVELVIIRSAGDLDATSPLAEIGGQGVFTRALDDALLGGEVDLAVHSLKDLPTRFTPGIELAAVPEREDARDVLIGPEGIPLTLETLPKGARLGTGSLRRQALALAFRPDLDVRPIRGNLDTRIGLVDAGEQAAIVLAAAGVRRMGWAKRVSEALDLGGWLPAPGQGALAVVIRSETRGLHAVWATALDHPPTRAAVEAERAVLHALEAGCQLPVGALGLAFGSGLRLRAVVVSPDGRQLVRADASGDLKNPEALGFEVARKLRARGADRVLAGLRNPGANPGADPGANPTHPPSQPFHPAPSSRTTRS